MPQAVDCRAFALYREGPYQATVQELEKATHLPSGSNTNASRASGPTTLRPPWARKGAGAVVATIPGLAFMLSSDRQEAAPF
jgi:hypothetical protein